jgi:ABC-type multidrug transport system ATPase subunit
MLEIRNVTKRFFSLTAVNNVSFKISQGEVLGLLGPNGAGKTTLLKLIAGLLYPDSGAISFAGATRPAISLKPERLLYPNNLRVSQYLKMVARLSNLEGARADRVVAQVLDRVKLAEASEKRIKDCSKGMRQRLGLAQVMIGHAPLVLIDEPSNGLDPEGQADICGIINELRAEGRTLVMSSHQLHEVRQVCTRIIILNRGKIHYDDSLAKALAMRPRVTIQATQDLDFMRAALTALHPCLQVEGAQVILDNEAVTARRQVLRAILEAGLDVCRVEQARGSLEEIYAEVVQ